MVGERSNCIDERQAKAYEFPYHYIPNSLGFPWFSRRWSWSASYIAAVLLAEKWLVSLPLAEHHCHMDFGCGDGGFIHALKTRGVIKGVKFLGVDFDDHAIAWAKIFHDRPDNFSCRCISALQEESYDSGSLIEVFEHIPPDECSTFVANMAKSLKKDAFVFVTVPSTQKKLSAKHYRHFDFNTLATCFERHFRVEDLFGFEKEGLASKPLAHLLDNRFLKAETNWSSKYLISCYERKHAKLKGCGRIGMIISKR